MPRNISKHTDTHTLIHVRVHPLSFEANLEDATFAKMPEKRTSFSHPDAKMQLMAYQFREFSSDSGTRRPKAKASDVLISHFVCSLSFSPLRRSIAYRARLQTFSLSLILLRMSWQLCKMLPPLSSRRRLRTRNEAAMAAGFWTIRRCGLELL